MPDSHSATPVLISIDRSQLDQLSTLSNRLDELTIRLISSYDPITISLVAREMQAVANSIDLFRAKLLRSYLKAHVTGEVGMIEQGLSGNHLTKLQHLCERLEATNALLLVASSPDQLASLARRYEMIAEQFVSLLAELRLVYHCASPRRFAAGGQNRV